MAILASTYPIALVSANPLRQLLREVESIKIATVCRKSSGINFVIISELWDIGDTLSLNDDYDLVIRAGTFVAGPVML